MNASSRADTHADGAAQGGAGQGEKRAGRRSVGRTHERGVDGRVRPTEHRNAEFRCRDKSSIASRVRIVSWSGRVRPSAADRRTGSAGVLAHDATRRPAHGSDWPARVRPVRASRPGRAVRPNQPSESLSESAIRASHPRHYPSQPSESAIPVVLSPIRVR